MSEFCNKPNDSNEQSNVPVVNGKVCPLICYGCKADQELISFKEHCTTELHQKILVKLAKKISEENKDNSNIDVYIKRIIVHLQECYEKFSRKTQDIETLTDEILRLNSEILLMTNQETKLTENINDTKTDDDLQKDQIEAMLINQNVLTQDFIGMKQQVDHKSQISKYDMLDGTMTWKISSIREKMYDAQSERQTSVYSPAFYTSDSGYKLCIRLYLNGDGSARGTHTSIFLVVLRGEYDALLKWPFSYRVSFCLYDQRTMIESGGTRQATHIIESFRPDINSVSFRQPNSAMNIASGIPKFCSLVDLNQPEEINRYILNDVMFIRVFIDFAGLSKSILPFVFNLNIALPVQIRQKLLDDEIKRREQQNIS